MTKRLLKHGVLLALESGGYGAGGAVSAATDGFHVTETPEVDDANLDEGVVQGKFAGSGGPIPRVQRNGRWGKVSLQHYAKTPGAAYSASVKATIDTALRLCAHSVTVVTTGGAEKRTYAPVTEAAFESGVGEFYDGAEKDPMRGIFFSGFEVGAEGLVVPQWKFDAQGIMDDSSDSAVPAITYPNETQALQKAVGMVSRLTLGATNYTMKIRRWMFKFTRNLAPLIDQTLANGAHPGFVYDSTYSTECEVLFDAPNLTATPYITAALIDPRKLADTGTKLVAAIEWGGAQYSRFKIAGNQVQLANVKKDKAGAKRLWSASLLFNPSSPVADDGHSIVTD